MSEFARNQNRTVENSLLRPAQPERSAAETAHELNPQPWGNQAARQFAESCPLSLPNLSVCPFGGACHACPAQVQTKLEVSQPDDPYEQEADRVAEQVMAMPEPKVQRACPSCENETVQTKPLADQITPLAQRQEEESKEEEEAVQPKSEEGVIQRQEEPEEEKPPEEEEEEEEPAQAKLEEGAIQRQEENPEEEEEEEPVQPKSIDESIQRQEEPEEDEEKGSVQAKRSGGGTPRIGPGLAAQIHSLHGGGQPLTISARRFFEPRFGVDFGQVRVHAGDQAAKTTQVVNARAFTLGQDIVFGLGQYDPGTIIGKRLLGHELAHVVQQGVGKPASIASKRNTLEIKTNLGESIQRSIRTISDDHKSCLETAEKRQSSCYDRGAIMCSILWGRLGGKVRPLPAGTSGGVCYATYNRACRFAFKKDIGFCNRMKACLKKGVSIKLPPSECGSWWKGWSKGGTGNPWPDFDPKRDEYADWYPRIGKYLHIPDIQKWMPEEMFPCTTPWCKARREYLRERYHGQQIN
jgi:flagellar biosynthesis GTPase FlhF